MLFFQPIKRKIKANSNFNCTHFVVLGTGCMFPRALLSLHQCFPTLLPSHRLHVFPRFAKTTYLPRLAPAACFPALCTGYISVSPRYCLGTGCMFSRALQRLHACRAWHRLYTFPALGTACIFISRVIQVPIGP